MSDFSSGFIQGFLNQTTAHIKEKKDEADKYFTDQLDLARTRGLKNRDATQQLINGHVQTAKQLQSIGVPTDLVMSIAKQNPDDLAGVMKTIQDLQMEGINPDEAFYRDLIQTSGQYKAPDEDLSTFIANLYKPLRSNIEADKGAFNDDPAGSLWATMMGTNAHERASQRLEDTIVADGLSAAELNRYSDNPTSNSVGSPTVTINASKVGDAARAAKAANRGADELSPSERTSIVSRYEEVYGEARGLIQRQYQEQHPEDDATTWDQLPTEVKQQADVMAAAKLSEEYKPSDLLQIPRIARFMMEQPEGDGPSENAPLTFPREQSAPQDSPPQGSVRARNGAVLYKDLGNGKSVWLYPDGTKKVHLNKDIGYVSPSEDPSIGSSDIRDILSNPTGN